MAVDQPMSITQAVSYCRQNYAALASIHSWEEQQQVISACLSMVSDPSTGETVHGDQAAYGGYGCWIGFEDSASEGGFIWEDGSSVDFVHWTPGEPNGADSESAVVVDLRGHMGSQDIWLPTNGFRNGEWNDDSRSDGQLLYPVCETSIPQAIPGAARVWGTGATSSFNIKVCVDGTDTLFFQVRSAYLFLPPYQPERVSCLHVNECTVHRTIASGCSMEVTGQLLAKAATVGKLTQWDKRAPILAAIKITLEKLT